MRPTDRTTANHRKLTVRVKAVYSAEKLEIMVSCFDAFIRKETLSTCTIHELKIELISNFIQFSYTDNL